MWDESAGYATFEHCVRLPRLARFWMLKRVWLEPRMRRRGLLTAAWPLWLERYGEFEVANPNEAMQEFLRGRARTVPTPVPTSTRKNAD